MASRRFQTIALFSLLTMLVSAPAFAQRVPLWAVGMFEGYNRKYAAQVELTIRRDGQVIARNRYDNGRRDTAYGSWRNGRIYFGATELDVDQIGDGIRLVQIGDRANVVRYRRIGPGYDYDRDNYDRRDDYRRDDDWRNRERDYRDRDYRDGYSGRVPEWAVGVFRGYNRKYRAAVELIVRRNGEVVARNRYDNGRRDTAYGSWRNGRIYFGATELDVDQIGDGIRLVQIGDRANVVRYQRID